MNVNLPTYLHTYIQICILTYTYVNRDSNLWQRWRRRKLLGYMRRFKYLCSTRSKWNSHRLHDPGPPNRVEYERDSSKDKTISVCGEDGEEMDEASKPGIASLPRGRKRLGYPNATSHMGSSAGGGAHPGAVQGEIVNSQGMCMYGTELSILTSVGLSPHHRKVRGTQAPQQPVRLRHTLL